MDVRVGHLPDPYRLDTAYIGGQPVGTVEKLVMNEPDRFGPHIGRALREGVSFDLQAADSGAGGR